ncbi:MAG: hypothetical protein C4294_16665, partial [Nitrospiraceae bacterium]
MKAILIFFGLFWLALPDSGVLLAASQSGSELEEARHAFKRRQYDRTLALVEPLLKGTAAPVDARRLKIKSLVRLERPVEALAEYDRLVEQVKQEDRPLLREVAISFITPLLKDMREQMRGAAYTALKELDSDETVSYFEDGLSDGSGLVRALAVEGLGKNPAGRRSPKMQKALDDQASIVRIMA